MLVESNSLRKILSTRQKAPTAQSNGATNHETAEPSSNEFPMNPMPALVILLLGKMMSSHQQDSMVSSMLHSLWGNLLIGAACSRISTYILLYISPPKSTIPGRPPTELLSAFCFMAGGMLFMGSVSSLLGTFICENTD